MDVEKAIEIARQYVERLYASESITNLGLEETEHDKAKKEWRITMAFSRPWNTPRTRTQEVLDQLGATSSLRRAYKVITISDDGDVIAMKNRQRAEVAD